MTSLRIQISDANCIEKYNKHNNYSNHISVKMIAPNHLADIIRDHLDKNDSECMANDELHKFTSEGSGNTTGSLSSISMDKCQEEYNLMQFNTKDNNNSIGTITRVKHIETGLHF
ncbi:unnamed protein product [Oppiella nova]|uniref:Uncharacterized protein n=1 Tax=Oppiella nova TaxID=334625 RepID=A0A7R9QQ58_9ACAR|nr:unnamed protein product [Oppiella nova]CAG2170263.1 unnamed protein product [Oppiella nova]